MDITAPSFDPVHKEPETEKPVILSVTPEKTPPEHKVDHNYNTNTDKLGATTKKIKKHYYDLKRPGEYGGATALHRGTTGRHRGLISGSRGLINFEKIQQLFFLLGDLYCYV